MRTILVSLLLFWISAIPVHAKNIFDSSTAKSLQPVGSPPAVGDQFSHIRTFIRQQLVEQQVPSIAVAVAVDGEIIWEEAFGWADREKRIPANEHTMYSIASITKPFTATAMMILRERGEIDFERPINDYLGDAKLQVRVGNPDDATVGRVLNHTAGLPLHYQFFYSSEPGNPRPSMDESILRYGNTVTPPGEKCNYSNFGYGLIDYVISKVSGKSYADFMKTEVFLPLGLTRTSVDVGPGLEPYQAVRYGADGLPIPFYTFDHPGGSAIYASAHDLVRFGLFHLKTHLPDQRAIISDASIDEMHRATAQLTPKFGYGIGWISEDRNGHRMVFHSGGMGGVSTMLGLFPAENVVITVMTNSSSILRNQVFERTLAMLLPDAALKEAPPPEEEPGPFTPPVEYVGTWKGTIHTYEGDVDITLEFKPSGDVHARLGKQLKTLVNRVVIEDGYLTGRFMSNIGTTDANRLPYALLLSLKLRGDDLNGAVTVYHLPGKLVGNALSHWAELTRQADN